MARFPVQNTAATSESGVVRILPNAVVSVVDSLGADATLYAAATGTEELDNPLTADGSGNYVFWLDLGDTYTVTFTLGSKTQSYFANSDYQDGPTIKALYEAEPDTKVAAIPVPVTQFGVVYNDRTAEAANGAAINAALAHGITNNVGVDLGQGNIFCSVPIVQDGFVNVTAGGFPFWNKNGVATTNLPAAATIIMTGTGSKDQTIFGISSCQAWGGKIANQTPQSGYNDADYILRSYITGSATADGQALRPFSAAWTLTKNAEGSSLRGFRVIPDGGGDDGMDYYQTGSVAASTALTSGDWDVGLFANACKEIDIECQFVGQWRDRLGLLAVPHSDTFPATLYRARFDKSTFSGTAVRGVDHAPITATTTTTFDIPFAEDHPFTTEGTTVRLSSGGRTSTEFTFTSVTRVTDGIAAGVDSLRFNGVSPDPTGKTGCLPDYKGGGTSGMTFHGAQLLGFGHGSEEPSENEDLTGTGLGPYANPMNTVEISGNELTEIDMSLAELETYETVSVYLGDCRHVTLPTYIEANGDGSRIIYWGPRASNPNTAHSSVPATSETMEPHFYPKGSTLLGGNLDLRPYIQDFDAPTRFNGGSDNGLMIGIRNNSPKHGLHAYMDIGSILMAPKGGVAALGKRTDSGDFTAPSISDYTVGLDYDGDDDVINVRSPATKRYRPHITGVTFAGTGGALYDYDGESASFQLQNDTAALVAMSADAEIYFAKIRPNQNSSEWGHFDGKTDAAPFAEIINSSTNFTVLTSDLTGTTGTVGDLSVAARQGAIHIENRTGGKENEHFALKAVLST